MKFYEIVVHISRMASGAVRWQWETKGRVEAAFLYQCVACLLYGVVCVHYGDNTLCTHTMYYARNVARNVLSTWLNKKNIYSLSI